VWYHLVIELVTNKKLRHVERLEKAVSSLIGHEDHNLLIHRDIQLTRRLIHMAQSLMTRLYLAIAR
jgi:hypothetical protein